MKFLAVATPPYIYQKQTNEEMEAELMKMDSRPENLAVSEDERVDEAVPINITGLVID